MSVFAGQDREATEQARRHFADYPPSSPSIALLRDSTQPWPIELAIAYGASGSTRLADLSSALAGTGQVHALGLLAIVLLTVTAWLTVVQRVLHVRKQLLGGNPRV